MKRSDTGKGKAARHFYARVLSQEEIAALAELAANHPSLQDEIALLKVLIRRKLEEGTDLPTISRAIDALGRALKVQKQTSDEGQRELQDAFLKALVELGEGQPQSTQRAQRKVP